MFLNQQQQQKQQRMGEDILKMDGINIIIHDLDQ